MRFLSTLLLAVTVCAQQPKFENGLPTDPAFFPIGVWLQSPHNAQRYADLGVNLYVGLFGGPTAAQLDALERVGMRTICAQNEVGLAHAGKVIVGWMHDDEPDNAQPATVGYGPPVEPWKVVEGYEAMRKRDPTRPVLLNLGQGAAWDQWHGRGARTDHPEDYPEYLKGCDIGSFDIYPVTHDRPAVAGRLEFVGHGVRRMRDWSGRRKPIWACIETGHVNNAKVRPTPAQVRSEVWMAITCGAEGIIYFAHEFEPRFVEASVFAYPEIEAAVKAINAEVLTHAKVLAGETLPDAVTVKAEASVAVLCKRDGRDLVLFTASMTGAPVEAAFTLQRPRRAGQLDVLGEKRKVEITDGRFTDTFAGYGVHHYRLSAR